ncbi:putative forkhead-associated (FHA) domain, SMAD/FHA domain superfamily [Plasmopara halstedii]
MQASGLEERKKALEKKFVEKRPPLAYAKLSGRVEGDTPFEKLITHLPAELGRGPVSPLPDHRITLGEQKAISRLHARIQWNQSESCFELQCLGKNGMFADGKFVSKNQTIKLSSKMPLKIGHARVYFLCAIRSTISTMSGYKIIQKVHLKRQVSQGVITMTADQVCDQILESFPKSEQELGGRDHLRNFIMIVKPVYTMRSATGVTDTKKIIAVDPSPKPEDTSMAPQKKQKISP